MLVDRQIREYVLDDKLLGIEPFREEALQPASYDLHLGHDFQIFRPSAGGQFLLDLAQSQDNCWKTAVFPKTMEATDGSGRQIPTPLGMCYLDLEPGGFVLATTEEVVSLPDDMVARVEGKSSLGRSGLLIHVTAGFIDPGFNGEITLELKNLLPIPMRIYPGMPIAQLSFLPTYNDAVAQKPYTGKYHGQSGATVAQFWRNF